MSEDINIPSENSNLWHGQDQIPKANEEKLAENSRDINEPATGNKKTEAIPQPENTNMEAHAEHLHKAPGYGWKHYLFEFFMLFLAVFCGFIAEDQREHLVEHRREKQYMKSLLEDLQKDTADLNHDIPFWELQLQRIDTIRKEIDKLPNDRNKITLYSYAGYMRWYDKFVYHDRTILQLKNGGNFRLIRKSEIADSLIDYDAAVNSELRDIEAQSNNLWQSVNFLQNRIFSSRFYSSPGKPQANPRTIEIRGNEDQLFEYYNLLDYYSGLNTVRNMENKLLVNKATNLILEIKKDYHLK